VPVYNAAKHLDECVESLAKQSYKNIEVILVDDGSLDQSGQKCESWARKDSRIKVVHQKNAGSNMARKSGFEVSNGEFIMFVDADDIVSSKCVCSLCGLLIKHDVDIAIAAYQNFIDKSELHLSLTNNLQPTQQHKNEPPHFYKEVVLNKKLDIIRYYLTAENCSMSNIYQVVPWGRLFRREIIDGTDWNFANYNVNEDEFESLQWFDKVERGIAIKDEKLYFYRQNSQSKMLSIYKNIDPQGNEINRFEMAKILYDKTQAYLNNPIYEKDLLWRYSFMNQYFLDRLVESNSLEASDIKSANKNYKEIIEAKSKELVDLRQRAAELELHNQALLNSRTWKAGRIAQKLGTPIIALKEKLRIRTRIRSLRKSTKLNGIPNE
jgi:glycosyltransferase involved in cell wall biosynthesis